MSPPQGDYLEAVRSSCRALTENGPVKVSADGIRSFLKNLDKHRFEELSVDTPIRMPLKFDTLAEELNFVALIDLLNFGSGYRVPLHELAGRGAFDTIRFGAMSFHIGGTPMDAATFKSMTAFKVSEIFQFPIDREVKPKDMPFITMTEPTELKQLADGITTVLNTTGEFLEQHKYNDLAAFILDLTKPVANQKPSASKLVEHLTKALPGLRDISEINGRPVYVLKKAQILVYHLWMFFRDQEPDRFDFADIDNLTVFADNVVPTLLVHLGVLEIPESWQADITDGQDLGEIRATTLRAASIVACEDIVELVKQNASVSAVTHMNEGHLDVYLWRLGKEGDYRKIPRFALRDTVMF
ncbi:hypothetical protein BDB00DRAFT_850026 [Zychaea mexicana]|uniref:uncharacterized protein n=1 Tax=Zychaea mexicana TaxID=64656 RepID=UPI0022FEB216|nr:uncharacterized protein BDB00DRAFT_850026 [Zychaea mexicana]KAI9488101.1 hypothetical protein BDB00DRAFT_850026 [Zychaea mexicana]